MRLLGLFPKLSKATLHPDLSSLTKFHPEAHKYFGKHLVIPGKEKLVGSWLLFSSGCVFFMIGLGGYTRLTKSGLSMTYWKPLSIDYPQNDEQWMVEFQAYKNFPEFQQNTEMELATFKSIFFYEYFHRLVGRGIGLVFGVPFAYFLAKGYLLRPMKLRCGALFTLGGIQGAIVKFFIQGWWMVKSGLEKSPDYQSRQRVSTYRLAFHLNTAIVIYSGLFWNALNLLRPLPEKSLNPNNYNIIKSFRNRGVFILPFVAFNIVSGVAVAGIDAGKVYFLYQVYNTWPSMNGFFFSQKEYLKIKTDAWRNFFENKFAVQFNHRIFAYTTYIFGNLFYLSRQLPLLPVQQRAATLLFLLINGQLLLGVYTLLQQCPAEVACAHQCGALTVLSSALLLIHTCRRPSRGFRQYVKHFI